MGKIKLWCPAGADQLPPDLRDYWTEALPVLGNTIERSRMDMVVPDIGSLDAAWEINEKLTAASARLLELSPDGAECLSGVSWRAS